ncbi:MAG: hypothetical protein VZR22_02330 [Candidatus Cryptobacteroides sp.]|nr:hypothetical protein [Candidatus Cryptobacteroides sp.]
MTDKEKYTALMQRYWEAETTPEEERELALFAAGTDSPDFAEIRGVLGYLAIGREKKVRRARTVRMYSLAAIAASLVAVTVVGLHRGHHADQYSRHAYGEFTADPDVIMPAVDASLANFFGETSPAEANLIDMFKR